jgi:hypothetical protein
MGVTQDKVKQMTDTFNGHLKELESAFQGLIITIGNDLLPALTDFVKWLTKATSNVEKFYSENKELIHTISQLVAVFFALSKVKSIIEAILGAKAAADIAKISISIKGLKEVVLALGAALTKLGKANAVILALTLAIEGLNWAFDEWEKRIKKLDESSNRLKTSTKSFNDIIQELKRHMKIDENGIKTFTLTKEEIEKLKKETKDLIEANNKRIKQLKAASDGSREYKNMIAALVNQNKTLKLTLEKLSTLKPYKNTTKSAIEAKEAVKQLSAQELAALKDTYTKRVKTHEAIIEKLKAKEVELAKRIEEIQTQLQQRLKELETQRLNAIEDIENKIHNIQLSNASSYEKYVDKQKQAEIALAKAKEAIRSGDLAQAKRYMSQYENLVSSLANKEIKKIKEVKKYNWEKHKWEKKQIEEIAISKEQANKIAVNGLKKLESLTNEYYTKAKAQEKAAANAKLANLKAELQATKAQLQLEIQRLNIEKQLIETLTGKKVTIDTSAAFESIKNLDAQIKNIDEKLKEPKKVKADTSEAQKKVNEIDKKIDNTKSEIKIKADTKEAVAGILEIKDKVKKEKEVIKFYADNKEAKKKIKDVDLEVKSLKPLVKVNSDVSRALANLNKIPKTITTIHYVKTVETHASGGIAGFRRVSGKIPGDDPLNSDDVPALLTRGEFVIRREAVKHYGEDFLWKLNAKILPRFATGGLVRIGEPQKLIEQISSSFKSDRLSGNSYNDSDFLNRLDGYIDKLNELLEYFKYTPNNSKVKEIKSEIEKINTIKTEYKQLENDKTSKENKLISFKENTKDKTLNENEYKTYNNQVKNLEDKAKQAEEKVNSFIQEKAKNLDKEVNDLVKKIEKYVVAVEKIKDMIKNRLSSLSIDESLVLPDDFDYVMDLDRLNNFYNKLISLNIPSADKLKIEFERIARKTINTTPEYLQVGYSLINNLAYKPIDYSSLAKNFLSKYKVKDDLLEYRLTNLLKYKKQLATLSDENIQILMSDILKKLPRFATGGLIALQKGGKLAGYGGGDRNLALLEDGEFVIRKEAVRAFGTDLFNSLNSLKLPKFASGGYVGSASNVSYSNPDVNVNLNIGNKSFRMQTDEMTAKALDSYLKKML